MLQIWFALDMLRIRLVIAWHKKNLVICELLDSFFVVVHEVFEFVLAEVLKLVDREDLHLPRLSGHGPLVLGGIDLVVVKNRGLFILVLFWWGLRLYKKTVDCLALCFELRALQRMNSPSWLIWQNWGSVKWLADAVEFGLTLNSFWKSFNTFCGRLIEALLSQVQWFSIVI